MMPPIGGFKVEEDDIQAIGVHGRWADNSLKSDQVARAIIEASVEERMR